MLYRRFGKTNETVSALGFGCMRLPLLPGDDPTRIDEDKAAEMLRYAIDNGINYIDTAYPYHGKGMSEGGQSEPFVGKVLKNGYREKVKLATKLPSWLIKTREDMDIYLDRQLKRLETDHIDFYLVHSLNRELWSSVKSAGVTEFLDQAIKDGRIGYAGFSFHDSLDLFKEIVDSYDWSFCQIQYNYLDENFQAGKQGLRYAAQKGLGVAVMEPLRGGKLACNLPESVQAVFESAKVKGTPADWALRWVWNHPEVSVALSGMSTMEQLRQNLKTADEAEANTLDGKDIEMFNRARDSFWQSIKVGCTGCSYCMPCPQGVNIPACFEIYNNYLMFGTGDCYFSIASAERASNCAQCGKCEKHCPQGLSIRQHLKDIKAAFE